MKVVIIIIFILCACVMSACGGQPAVTPDPDLPTGTETNAPAIYRRIGAVDAKVMMDSGEPYILLDVRTLEEYTESRIEGATLIPYDEITARAESELPDKTALILIYCRSGRRSATAAETLVGMGYTNVFDFGGILDWPYDTVT